MIGAERKRSAPFISPDSFMRKKILNVVGLMVFWIWLLPCADASQVLHRPNWSNGKTWKVGVSYPDYTKKGEWTSPVFWKYKLTEGTSSDEGYVIEIYPLSDETTPVTILHLHKEDLSPNKIESLIRRRGQIIRHETDFESIRPVITQTAMAPIDLPVFPLREGETTRYSVMQEVAGDLKRKREIIVTKGIDRIPESLTDDSGKASEFIKVTAAYNDGEVLFTQYWTEGKPWPSFGENNSMRYWLVEDED